MEAQLKRAGMPSPQVIGIDEIAIRKGHTYRIVVSDLLRGRPIWFGGKDRSEASMGEFYARLGKKKSSHIRLGADTTIPHSRSRWGLWRRLDQAASCDGHPGSADRTAITMAKWTYGEAHRLDPTEVP